MNNLKGLEDKVYNLGAARADREHKDGHVEPTTGPLSGEWAGDPTPASLLGDLGLNVYETPAEDADELAHSYEDGYFGAWAAILEDEGQDDDGEPY